MFWKGKDTFGVATEILSEKSLFDNFGEVHRLVDSAFTKCISAKDVRGATMRSFSSDSSSADAEILPVLTSKERVCIEEYTIIFAKYSQKAFSSFNRGYEKLAREAMAKMRQTEVQAR